MAESIPFDQRLARVLVRPFRRTPITPNQLTTLSLAAGLVSAALFAAGEPSLAHWAGCRGPGGNTSSLNNTSCFGSSVAMTAAVDCDPINLDRPSTNARGNADGLR